ncbi:hypothetical protein LguiA_018253 [Lonicera macranthoides]
METKYRAIIHVTGFLFGGIKLLTFFGDLEPTDDELIVCAFSSPSPAPSPSPSPSYGLSTSFPISFIFFSSSLFV